MTERRHRPRATGVLFAVLLSLAFVAPTLAPQATQTRANELSERISASQERQAELRRTIERQRDLLDRLAEDRELADQALDTSTDQLDGINVDQAALGQEIERATAAIERVEARRDALVAELRTLDFTLVHLDEEIAQAEADLVERQRLLGERIAAAYRTGQTSLLEQVLGSGSFAEVLTNVDAFLRFGATDVELARTIEADRARLASLHRLTAATRYTTERLRTEAAATEADLSTRRERLRGAKERLDALEAETRRLIEEQQREHDRIERDHAHGRGTLAEAEASEDALDQLIGELVAEQQRREAARLERQRQRELERQRQEREAARLERERRERERLAREREREREREERENQPSGSGGGGPLRWPTTGWVTQEYGCTGFSWEPSRGSCPHFHDGIDIANASGTPIRAAASGTVVFVGYNPFDRPGDRAWIVVVSHANGYDTRYAHLQARYASGVRSGSRVRAGQVIGWMGNTGYSTGVHLHWEVWRYGSPVNPRAHI